MHNLDDVTRNISREQFWGQHVYSWRDSGLFKRHYCQQHDLVYHQMIYWCSKNGDSSNTVSTTLHQTPNSLSKD